MKIKWKNVYFPIGEWVDENGVKTQVDLNFRCKHEGRDLICTMIPARCGAGHGEPAMTANVPSFIDAETLAPVEVDGFVDVVESRMSEETWGGPVGREVF